MPNICRFAGIVIYMYYNITMIMIPLILRPGMAALR
jgi:hypothetical protein